jgi:putative ABC transport system substrate-binding protein
METIYGLFERSTKRFCIFLGIFIFGMVLSGCGSKPKMYQVGILCGLEYFADTADGFKAKMTALGYGEGKNIVYDFQQTSFEPDKERHITEKFISDKVDLIFVFPTEVALEVKSATRGTKVPVIFGISYTEGTGLIQSVVQPGENITGVRWPGTDMTLKNFETLLEVIPKIKRIWVPYMKGYPSVPSQLEALRPVAAAAGVTVIEAPLSGLAEIKFNLQKFSSTRIVMDAVLTIYDPLMATPDAALAIVDFWTRYKVPVVGPVTFGGISGVIIDNIETGQLAAILADKILKGVPAGTIPAVSPEAHLWVNYKAMQKLGITAPSNLFSRAYKIIR